MYLKCKPIKTEEVITQMEILSKGGNCRIQKIQMSKEKWAELFGEPRKDGTNPRLIQNEMSGYSVEFTPLAGDYVTIVLEEIGNKELSKMVSKMVSKKAGK